jgi:hypothetical protein
MQAHRFTRSYPRHYIEVNAQLHTPAALPPVSTGYTARWTQVHLWRRCPCWESKSSSLVRSLVGLSWLLSTGHTCGGIKWRSLWCAEPQGAIRSAPHFASALVSLLYNEITQPVTNDIGSTIKVAASTQWFNEGITKHMTGFLFVHRGSRGFACEDRTGRTVFSCGWDVPSGKRVSYRSSQRRKRTLPSATRIRSWVLPWL